MKDNLIALVLFIMPLFGLNSALAQEPDTQVFNYKKPLFDFEYEKPLFKLQDEQLSNQRRFLRFSAITGYREGVKPIEGSFGINFSRFNSPETGTVRIAMYNLSIVEMLNHFPVKPEKVILEVKDPSRYMYDPKYGPKEAWMRKNAYCYEYIMPAGMISGITQFEDDISAWFGIQFSREKRMVPDVNETRRFGLDPVKGIKEVSVLVIKELN